MVKRKQKKVVKQKQKQNVNVKQNVKVVVGDVKRKQVRKATGAKASAKPPIVLNISNPQPYNNMYMEYFKKQLQNQQPIKANTLKQNEILNEREENKASKAGALHNLDQEPDDAARENKAQGKILEAIVKQREAMTKAQEKQIASSMKKIKTAKPPKPPKRPVRLVLEESSENSILSELEQQRSRMEQAITKNEESGAEAEGEESDVRATPVPTFQPPQKPASEKQKTEKRRGRKRLTEEEIEARLDEEKILRRERLGMIAEDKPIKRRGRKMLSQEEIDRKRNQREMQKLQKLFEEADTEGDY